MKENTKVTWGIIGCGDVTEKKSGPAFNKVEDSHLLAVMRRDAEKAADYARRHQVDEWYANAEDLLNHPDINAIYVATPPSSHLEYALAALEKGKAVYVEKPVALNAGEAVQMAEAVRKYNGKLVVAHYRRRLPVFLKVKALLEENAIGEVRTVQLRLWQSPNPDLVTKSSPGWRTDAKISGGGYFHDLSPHQLDLMLFFFGAPLHYNGFSQIQDDSSDVADQVSGTILFANKVVFNRSWCFNVADTDNIEKCEMIGSKGSISFSIFGGNDILLKNQSGEEVFSFDHPENIQHPMISGVVGFIKGEEPNPCSIEEAITVMKIIDAFSTLP